MNTHRKIPVVSIGCTACQDTIEFVQRLARNSCEASALDREKSAGAPRA